MVLNFDNAGICAVIVTYNRKEKLLECISAVLEQTCIPSGVYIIDNNSTDGTGEALYERGLLARLPEYSGETVEITTRFDKGKKVDVHYVHLASNTGGAGGFYEGIKRAYNRRYQWFWLMDDDGVPAADALEKLHSAYMESGDRLVLNSLVLDKDDHSRIAFGYWQDKNIKLSNPGRLILSCQELINVAADANILEGMGQFFNFTLINRAVVEKAGLPLKELFIRGDEVEYQFRLQMSGFKIYTAIDSIAFHPNPLRRQITLAGKPLYYEKLEPLKKYYQIRNATFVSAIYFEGNISFLRKVKRILANSAMELLVRRRLKDKIDTIKSVIRGVLDGCNMARHTSLEKIVERSVDNLRQSG